MTEIKNDNKIVILLSKYKIELLFFLVIILLFLLPRIFSANSVLFSFASENTGYVGDTIGGITAPIIGLFSALLVYLAFKEQVKANQELQRFNEEQSRYLKSQDYQNEWSYINGILDNIKLHFKDLFLNIEDKGNFEQGSYSDHAAVVKLITIYNQGKYTSIDPLLLYNILHNAYLAYNQIEYLLVKVKESNLNEIDKKYFYVSILRFKIEVSDLINKDIQHNNIDPEYAKEIKELDDSLKELLRQIQRVFIILKNDFPFK